MSDGTISELEVIPGENDYIILLDGVELCFLRHAMNSDSSWEQTEGNLPPEVISNIGNAIENHYT